MYDRDSLMTVKGMEGKINRIKNGANGTVWACTDGKGISEINGTDVVHTYTSSDGLSSDICYDITFDLMQHAWVATNRGLCRIDFSPDKKISVFNTHHGLVSNEISKVEIMNNELYICTEKGLCIADIDKFLPDTFPPPVYITSIMNDNKPMFANAVSAYNENNYSFKVDGISYLNPQGISYRYRLLGYDTTWRTTHTEEIIFNNLNDGKYRFEVLAVNANRIVSASPAVYSFTITPPFTKTIWFYILVFFSTVGAIYLLFLWRTSILRKKEATKTELNKMIAEYQMSALRAQMNPHFIFNAINSIQNYVLSNETQYAYDYLAQFSKLIRQVLANSQKTTIPLNKELEMLKVYLELECRRFKNKFDFEIQFDENLFLEEIHVPVMLIQPFVENSIWHGIMNLENDKKGKLLVQVNVIDDVLKITVEDNGIGREAAAALKKNVLHESVGILLTQKRIELLKAITNENANINVIDLKGENQIASGTRVEIHLPLNN